MPEVFRPGTGAIRQECLMHSRRNNSALLNYYTLRDAQKLHFMQFRAAGLGFSRILRENTSRDDNRLNGYGKTAFKFCEMIARFAAGGTITS